MNFKILLLVSILKLTVSSANDVKIISSNIDKATEAHVISCAFSLIEKQMNLKTFAKSLVENMNNNYGESWFCQIINNTSEEIYTEQAKSSYITLNNGEYHVNLFKLDMSGASDNVTQVS
jgi:hypothetical protein